MPSGQNASIPARLEVTWPAGSRDCCRVEVSVFEGKLNRQTIRQTIGDVRAWSIDAARSEANRLRVLLDRGTDPRELARDTLAAKAAMETEAAGRALTVADVWPRYMAEGKPKRRSTWKPRRC